MSPREFTIICKGKQYKLHLEVSAYGAPPMPHARLMVTLQEGPRAFTVLSVNFPDFPTPRPRQFYVKTWGENEGLLEQLLALGAVRLVLEEGIEINQWGSKTFVAELAWPDSALVVCLPRGYESLLQRKGTNSVALDGTVQHHGGQLATTTGGTGPAPGEIADAAGGRGSRYAKNQRKRERKKEQKVAAAVNTTGAADGTTGAASNG